jgi:hypothetical protein
VRRRLAAARHGLRPVIAGPGEPLDEALAGAGIDIGQVYAVAEIASSSS